MLGPIASHEPSPQEFHGAGRAKGISPTAHRTVQHQRAAARLGALALTAMVATGPLAAAPIDADGPDFVDSSEVVPQGRFQYEVDATRLGTSRSGRAAGSRGTSALLKYGVGEAVEVRLTAERSRAQDSGNALNGSVVGFKWHSTDRDPSSARPAVSWVVELGSAAGSPAFQSGRARPSARSIATWDLPAGFGFGLMPGLGSDVDSAGRRFSFAMLGVVMNRAVSDRDRLFVEASAPQIASVHHGGTIATWDVGGAHLLEDNVQLGFRSGFAANRRSPRNYVLIELAQRF